MTPINHYETGRTVAIRYYYRDIDLKCENHYFHIISISHCSYLARKHMQVFWLNKDNIVQLYEVQFWHLKSIGPGMNNL